MRKLLVLSLMASGGLATFSAGAPAAEFTRETQAERDARMEWFREARFGMFIHWGLYAVPAGEWQGKQHYGEWFLEETKVPVSEYEKYAGEFNPVRFDARAWARMAKDAGMRYVVITSKHHDGFGLWPSGLTDWCIKRTPFNRDPMKELAEACRAEGLKFCFYHSIMDWHHPDWGTRRKYNDRAPAEAPNMDRYVAFMKGQLKELVAGYGPLGILWFDGEWESPWTHERGVDLYNYVRALQPDIIINNRVGKGRSGMQGMDKGQGVGDYGTPEQEIPPTGFGPGVDWESCMTMNNHWGFNKDDRNWKGTETLVRNLIDCASKGGNYLLNIGPTAEGTFPAASVQRLAEIGKWMKVNGESIYGTTASPFNRSPWGRATQKPGRIYLQVFRWPANGTLDIPLRNEVKQARLLADPDARVTAARAENSVRLSVPQTAPDPIASVIVLDIEGKAEAVQLLPTLGADGTLKLAAEDATLTGHAAKLEQRGGVSNIGYWVNQKDLVKWIARVERGGTYLVEAVYALPNAAAGSRIKVSAQDSALECTLAPTGGWDKFETRVIGELRLQPARTLEFLITPLAKPGEGVMNLRELRLRPKEG